MMRTRGVIPSSVTSLEVRELVDDRHDVHLDCVPKSFE
jgi:hypothetical protein